MGSLELFSFSKQDSENRKSHKLRFKKTLKGKRIANMLLDYS
jgi:hypothetical protein